MELKIIKNLKDEVELQISSLTLAEILRAYLNKDSSVTFSAWKRVHPTEMPILSVKTKGKTAKKAINDALSTITKELDKALGDFSKLK